jgi:hypothetical protein
MRSSCPGACQKGATAGEKNNFCQQFFSYSVYVFIVAAIGLAFRKCKKGIEGDK